MAGDQAVSLDVVAEARAVCPDDIGDGPMVGVRSDTEPTAQFGIDPVCGKGEDVGGGAAGLWRYSAKVHGGCRGQGAGIEPRFESPAANESAVEAWPEEELAEDAKRITVSVLAGLGGIALWMEGDVDNPPVGGREEVCRTHFLTAEAEEKGEDAAYAPGPDNLREVVRARAMVGVGEGLAACLETERDAASMGWAADLVLPKGRGACSGCNHIRREPWGIYPAVVGSEFKVGERAGSGVLGRCGEAAGDLSPEEGSEEGRAEGMGEDVHRTVCPMVRRECSEVSQPGECAEFGEEGRPICSPAVGYGGPSHLPAGGWEDLRGGVADWAIQDSGNGRVREDGRHKFRTGVKGPSVDGGKVTPAGRNAWAIAEPGA